MFEIVYKFKRETAPGVYSDDVETKTVKVGQPYEDMPLEAAAGKIIAQLAKRSILVVDVECYEYTKKKLTVKIIDDGITIKHKKFSFDEGAMVGTACDTDVGATADQLMALLQSNPQLLQQLQQPQQNPVQQVLQRALQPVNGSRILRHEVFEPELPNLMEAKKLGLKFTLGRKYPIQSERMTGIPPVTNTFYTLCDDAGAVVEVNAKYFATAPQAKLAYEDEMHGGDVVGPSSEPKLLWGDDGAENFGMPDLRK